MSIVLRPDEALAHPGMAGRPALGVQVKLQPDGEILLKGANLMRAYHRSGEPAFDEQGWFHTGDLALLHDDGLYELVGRSKELSSVAARTPAPSASSTMTPFARRWSAGRCRPTGRRRSLQSASRRARKVHAT